MNKFSTLLTALLLTTNIIIADTTPNLPNMKIENGVLIIPPTGTRKLPFKFQLKEIDKNGKAETVDEQLNKLVSLLVSDWFKKKVLTENK